MDTNETHSPDWVRDAVFYHIFLDRFANGDTGNDPPNTQPWGSPPTIEDYQGGDLAGVIANLDYLSDLGVNALYLSPVFESGSNHGYDTTDYHLIDPRLGTPHLLKTLVEKAHERGWHVILDAVLNHSGVDFEPFRDLRENGEQSRFRNWYFPESFPIRVEQGNTNYRTWYGVASLPQLNTDNPETRQYLLDVGERWIKTAGIDGWRLDVPNEIPHQFWKEFRQVVRAANPDAYIVGEIWHNGRDWLGGDEFDSVMNYRFRDAVLDFLALDKISPHQCDDQLAQIRRDYPQWATDRMFNLLGSHDTERLRTMCGGDVNRERQCILLQLTYPGAPCIYYGDEIGLEGGKDPDCRRAFEWNPNKRDESIREFYKHLLALRRDHIALRRGDFQTVQVHNDRGIFAYIRTYENERVLVAVNRSRAEQSITLDVEAMGGKAWNSWLDSGAELQAEANCLCLTLPPQGMALFGRMKDEG